MDVTLVTSGLDLLLKELKNVPLDIACCNSRMIAALAISLFTVSVNSILTLERSDRLLPMTASPAVTAPGDRTSTSDTLSITALNIDEINTSDSVRSATT